MRIGFLLFRLGDGRAVEETFGEVKLGCSGEGEDFGAGITSDEIRSLTVTVTLTLTLTHWLGGLYFLRQR
jgi:hypothetical protein